MKKTKQKPDPDPAPPVEYFNPNPRNQPGFCWLSGAPLGQFGPGKAGVETIKKIR